jgi:hypothetical protein
MPGSIRSWLAATLSGAILVGACAESSRAEQETDAGGIDGGGNHADAGGNPLVPVDSFAFDQDDIPLPDGGFEERDHCNFETHNCVGEFIAEPYPVDEWCDFRNRRIFEFACDVAECRASIRYSRPDAVEEDGRIRLFGSTSCQQPAPPCEDLVTNDEGTPVRGSVVVHFEREALENALGCELTIPPRGWEP